MSIKKKEILKWVVKYFDEMMDKFGSECRGVGWVSLEAQRIRYRELLKVIRDEGKFSICDFGCGYGYCIEYLNENGFNFNYTGIDVSQKMIDAAKILWADRSKTQTNPMYVIVAENVEFICSSEILNQYDYIVSSGIFNVRNDLSDEVWLQYILDTLHQFNEHAIKGFSFNCLTKYSDLECMKKELYYADPLFLFDYCKRNFSRNVAILHDYEIYDFTIIVRK